MKRTELFALVVLLVGCCFGQVSPNTATTKSPSASPGYTLTVAPPADPIGLESPINITVTVTNTSAKEILWRSDRGRDSVYKAFRILLMKDGNEVETTAFQRRITGRERPDDPQGGGSEQLNRSSSPVREDVHHDDRPEEALSDYGTWCVYAGR